jgi:hypothetical protein
VTRKDVQGVLVIALATTGVAFIYWPAALIVAAVLLTIDLVT